MTQDLLIEIEKYINGEAPSSSEPKQVTSQPVQNEKTSSTQASNPSNSLGQSYGFLKKNSMEPLRMILIHSLMAFLMKPLLT